jgi:hypothetical protein
LCSRLRIVICDVTRDGHVFRDIRTVITAVPDGSKQVGVEHWSR